MNTANGSSARPVFFLQLLAALSLALATSVVAAAEATVPPGTNIVEANVRPYTLPELLTLANGKPVTDAKTWTKRRRPEIVLVHDCGPDGSDAAIEALAREHAEVRAVWLSRNFGQHAATLAGMAGSVGDWIATLDEDGQQDHPAPAPDPCRAQRIVGHRIDDLSHLHPDQQEHRVLQQELDGRPVDPLGQPGRPALDLG